MLNFKAKLFLLIMVTGLLWVGCRKVDSQPEKPNETPDVTQARFFGEHLPTNNSVKKIVEYAIRENKKYDFVNKIVSKVGYPRWDKTMIASSETGLSHRGSSDSSFIVYYIPFVRDSQAYVNASLIVKTTQNDTTVNFLCDWQYSQLSFGSLPDTALGAKNVFHLFTLLDNYTLGYNKFRITDPRLFSHQDSVAIANQGLSIDSATIVYSLDSTGYSGRQQFFVYTEICSNYSICISPRGFRMAGRNNTECQYGSLEWYICTTVVTEYYQGGTGGGGGGSGAGGGGNGSGGGWTPPPCPGGNARGQVNEGCTPGWTQVGAPQATSPCDGTDSYSGGTASLQYINLKPTALQFAPFDPNTSTQPEQYFVVNDVNGIYTYSAIQTASTNGGSMQGVTSNTVMTVHTHPFGAPSSPSAADFFELANFANNFQTAYIVGHNGAKYAMVVNNHTKLDSVVAANPNAIAPDAGFEPTSQIGTLRNYIGALLVQQGYDANDAFERANAYVMKLAGVTLVKANAGSDLYKKIGIRQKVINGTPAFDVNNHPIFENADCP
jgi:hypothetical protein